MAQFVFWCAALTLLHTYFFYPVILILWDRAARALRSIRPGWFPTPPEPSAELPLPKVSLVVAAYNEADCIREKIANSLAIDYPPHLFEVLIGSDGSTDTTDALVRACGDARVKLSADRRGGKASVLNRCIPEATGEIVILSDANTMIEPDAVKRLVRHFANPGVGAVCGRLKLFNRSKRDYEESAYWTYESLIKLYEGKRGAVMGANGGLYAIRRALFTHLPPTTIVDDFVIALRMVESGYQVLYDAEAVAREETTEDYQREFGRRARIAAGNFQSVAMVPGLLLPTAGFAAFAFWSHKLLRWSAPALMALALIANLFLLHHRFYQVTFAAQLAFYALAWLGGTGFFSPGKLKRVASVAYYFVVMNLAIAVGFWRFLRDSQAAAWDRTARLT